MPNIHDPSFALPAKPPFAWGKGPFRARGLLYKEEIAVADKALGGRAVDALAKLDPSLAAFLHQPFGALDWYDCMPIVYFGAAVARARGISFQQHTRDVAHAHAARAHTGFSGVVLRLISTEAVAMWLPRASAWYHDFGKATARALGPRKVRGERTGMPHFLVQTWSLSAMTFTEDVLTKSGAKEPRAHTLEAEQDGVVDGYPTFRIGFDLTWSE